MRLNELNPPRMHRETSIHKDFRLVGHTHDWGGLPGTQKVLVFCYKHQNEQFHNRKDEVHGQGGLLS